MVSESSPWWIEHLVTFVCTVIAALMIVYQLGRQHKNETARQNENSKDQLRLQIYQEISMQLARADDLVNKAYLHVGLVHTHSAIYAAQAAQGLNPLPVEERPLALHAEHHVATHEVIGVVFLIEKYVVVHPDLDIFKLAFGSCLHDASEALDQMTRFMFGRFPTEDDAGNLHNVRMLSDDELNNLHLLASAYQKAMSELMGYLGDLRVELQSLLLGRLFPNTIPRRRPADSQIKVISLEPSAVRVLRQHFLKRTAWGKRAVATALEVHAEHNERP
jgi:hypothetical protein